MSRESLFDARSEAVEIIDWVKDFRDGQFSPAHTRDGWTVEMHGLADSASELAGNYITALDDLKRVRAAIQEERRWATGTAEHNDARTALYILAEEIKWAE